MRPDNEPLPHQYQYQYQWMIQIIETGKCVCILPDTFHCSHLSKWLQYQEASLARSVSTANHGEDEILGAIFSGQEMPP